MPYLPPNQHENEGAQFNQHKLVHLTLMLSINVRFTYFLLLVIFLDPPTITGVIFRKNAASLYVGPVTLQYGCQWRSQRRGFGGSTPPPLKNVKKNQKTKL